MEDKRVDKELAKEFSLTALDDLKSAKYNSLISFQFNLSPFWCLSIWN
jgi:hypothetical protein